MHARAHRAIALSLAGVLLAGSAYAQPAPTSPPPEAPKDPPPEKTSEQKEAEQHFTRARQLYEEGDFALALVEFKRAYELSPNYRVLYNIGQVNIQLFNYAAARIALEKYLNDGGAEIPAARREQTEADLKMLRDRTAYLQITTVPAGDVWIDDLPVGRAPFEEPLLVNAGQRKIHVTREGYTPVTRVVTLAGGDRSDLRIELTKIPVEKHKPVIVLPTTTRPNYTPAVLSWIAAGTLGITSGIVGGFYLSKEAELERLSKPNVHVRRQDALDASASAERLAVAADILGLAAVGAGLAALYFTLRPPRTEVTAPTTVGSIHAVPGGIAGSF